MRASFEGFRLSPQQRTLWPYAKGSGIARVRVAIEDELDLDRLERALTALAERHEILRTGFRLPEDASLPLQVIEPKPRLEFRYQDRNTHAPQEPGSSMRHRKPQGSDGSSWLEAVVAPEGAGAWLLCLALPALCADRRSLIVVVEELAAIYAGTAENMADPVQYADIAEIFNDLAASEETRDGQEFWRDRRQAWDVPRLPFATGAGAEPNPCVYAFHAALPEDSEDDSRFLAMACWTLLLTRWCDRDRLTLGLCLDGRTFEELDKAVGPISRTLPMKLRVDQGQSPTRLAEALAEQCRTMESYQDYFSRDGDESPENAMPFHFEWQSPLPFFSAGAARFRIRDLDVYDEPHQLKLIVRQGDSRTNLAISYDASLFAESAIRDLAGQLRTLIERAMAQPETPARNLAILSEDEHRLLVTRFNRTETELPQDPRAHRLFEEQAARVPQSVALIAGRKHLGYAALNAAANRIARDLRSQGLGPDGVTAICCNRSVEMVAGVLAVLKAGGAFLPLDPAVPESRFRALLRAGGTGPVLADAANAPKFESSGRAVVRLGPLDIRPSDNSRDNTRSENLAYVLCTSGSTGEPKAVMVPHLALGNYLWWARNSYGTGTGNGSALHSPLGFDFTLTPLFVPLISGEGLLLLAEGSGAHTLQRLAHILAHGPRLAFLKLTPSHLTGLAQLVSGNPPAYLPDCLVVGGEALTRTHLAFLRQAGANPRIVNEYGPTEAVVGCCIHEVAEDDAHEVPIGGPIANTRLYNLDRFGNPVPFTAQGQLFIGGQGLARGYRARPDLTADRFIPDALAGVPGRRCYRSGDAVRFESGPRLAFLGRLDRQLKIRGHRIEPAEIEAALIRHPGIDEAVVMVLPDDSGANRLTVYLAAENGLSPDGLPGYLRERLPEAMIPERFVSLRRLPVNANGKVDLAALRAMPLESASSGAGPAPSENPMDRGSIEHDPVAALLIRLWAEVLQRDEVGVHDRFFDLGGHSLLLIRLHIGIRELLGIDTGIDRLFEAATVAAMTELLKSKSAGPNHAEELARTALRIADMGRDERRRQCREHGLDDPGEDGPLGIPIALRDLMMGRTHGGAATHLRIRPRPNPSERPLSFAQQRLWFLEQLAPGTNAFNNPLAVRMVGPVDPAILEACFAAIERRHESMRTSFGLERGQPVQIVNPPKNRRLPLVDLSGLAPVAGEDPALNLARDEARLPFDLSLGPVWRAVVLHRGEGDRVLLVTMHHICTDAESLRIFIREAEALYRHKVAGRSDPLPPLTVQYADYAYWQRQWLRGETLDSLLAFWREQLEGGAFEPFLPTDRPRPAVQSSHGAMHRLRFPPGLADPLRELGKAEKATTFMTLLGGFAVLLHFLGQKDDLIVGTDVANRNQRETERLIGFFVNQLALRIRLGDDPSLRALLARVRQTCLAAFARQEVPFDEVVKALNLERTPGHAPLFQVKLFLEHAPGPVENEQPIGFEQWDIDPGTARLDLTLGLWDSPLGLTGWLNYNTDLFDATTAARMARLLELVLETMAKEPDLAVSDVRERLASESDVMRRAARSQRLSANLKKFKPGKRKVLQLEGSQLVTMAPLTDQGSPSLPLAIGPKQQGMDLGDWIRHHRSVWEPKLLQHGALLFRGFGFREVAGFEEIATGLLRAIFTENSEHRPVTDNGAVQIPVDYAADQHLLWHNENSFNFSWPGKIVFGCARPAAEGGETPVADSRAVFRRIEPRIRNLFLEKGVMYVRNYSRELGLDWRTVFRTEDKREVEAFCRANRMITEWSGADRLKTRAIRPAAVKHPGTGEWTWFNQAQHWHPSCLDPKTRASLTAVYAEEDLPRHCYFGDGSAIDDEVMTAILDIYRELEVCFPWRLGDVMVLDNLLAAHARRPYSGERKILVSLGDMATYDALEPMEVPS